MRGFLAAGNYIVGEQTTKWRAVSGGNWVVFWRNKVKYDIAECTSFLIFVLIHVPFALGIRLRERTIRNCQLNCSGVSDATLWRKDTLYYPGWCVSGLVANPGCGKNMTGDLRDLGPTGELLIEDDAKVPFWICRLHVPPSKRQGKQ